MAALTAVPIGRLSFDRFESILPPERYRAVRQAVERARELFAGRVVWNVNSTARGGGVAEMLVSLLAYAHGADVDARWQVIPGGPEFFALTKRVHNHLHSAPGDGGRLDEPERRLYETSLAPSVEELLDLVGPRDVVIVHDPQPAGLIPALKDRRGTTVIWRCHVGIDKPSALARGAWNFLRPYVARADACVFSRKAFQWEDLDASRTEIIAPVIDPFSTKNQDLSADTVAAILRVVGLAADADTDVAPVFHRVDETPEHVTRPALIWEERPLRSTDPVVLQVSRWDRLKDPLGVIAGFAEHVAPHTEAHLVYAGPAVEAVADDPEGGAVLAEARALYERLPAGIRERVHLVCLPMADLDENAAIVNALQRRAAVVVQKSVAEGFGLTVAEAMWKARPVVASRIGGIQDQIADGATGVLLDDARDIAAYGAAVRCLLGDPGRAETIGRQAQARVRDEFLAVRSLVQYADLIARLLGH